MNFGRLKYCVLLVVMALLFAGCGAGSKNSKTIIGTWIDGKEKLTFTKDGAFRARQYFVNGSWEEFEEGKILLDEGLFGTERYFYEISDDGILTLTNCYKNSDDEWQKGQVVLTFVREGQDISILDEEDDRSEDSDAKDEESSVEESSAEESSSEESKVLSEEEVLEIVKKYLKAEFNVTDYSRLEVSVAVSEDGETAYYEIMNPNKDGDHPMIWFTGSFNIETGDGDIDGYMIIDKAKYFDGVNYYYY